MHLHVFVAGCASWLCAVLLLALRMPLRTDQRSAHATPLGREGLFAPALGTCAFLVGRLQGKLAKSCACRSHWSAVVC